MEIRHKNINGIELELVKKTTITDWWFGTFFIFPYIGNNDPDWPTNIFQRGWNHQPDTEKMDFPASLIAGG